MFRETSPQRPLFSVENRMDPVKRARLEQTWAHQYRNCALPLIDEARFAKYFDPDNGRPNKSVRLVVSLSDPLILPFSVEKWTRSPEEAVSDGECRNEGMAQVVSVLVLKEVYNLTDAEALDELEWNLAWQYALDITTEEAHSCQKTLHNYRTLLTDDDEGAGLFESTNSELKRGRRVTGPAASSAAGPARPGNTRDQIARDAVPREWTTPPRGAIVPSMTPSSTPSQSPSQQPPPRAPYTGSEPGFCISEAERGTPSEIYQLRPASVPADAVPVLDQELGAVIGYTHEPVGGVYHHYDLDGHCVGMDEAGLESPLIDPIDLLLLIGGLVAVLRGSLRVAAGRAAAVGVRAAGRGLSQGAVAALRALFLRINRTQLQFTATTAARMASRARRVPVHILRLAIRHGTRSADPEGVAGVVQYAIPMLRNGRSYTLKVILRVADSTVLHFHYF